MTPAAIPIISAPRGSTKPDAGVIATSPATAPEMMPSTLGLPLRVHSVNIQARAAVAVAIWVTAIAMPALPLAAVAEPALKPNQPTHSSEAPITLSTRLCGAIASVPNPRRLPITSAAISPATPELTCTTVPPAKSSTPASLRNPSGPIPSEQSGRRREPPGPMNHNNAENFIRPAKDPQISAGVIIAKVIWKHIYTDSGIVLARSFTESMFIPSYKKRLNPPTNGSTGEGEAVADRHPQDCDEAGHRKALCQRRQNVHLADHAAIGQRRTGDRHHQNERGRGQ